MAVPPSDFLPSLKETNGRAKTLQFFQANFRAITNMAGKELIAGYKNGTQGLGTGGSVEVDDIDGDCYTCANPQGV